MTTVTESQTHTPFGVHRDGPFPHDSQRVASILNEVSEVGAQWLRINVPWDWIEREAGVLEWERLDLVVDLADSLHIGILATVRGYSDPDPYPGSSPAKLRAYESFLEELVRRYSDRIHYWQIENEVTSSQGWHGPLSDYLAVLRAAYTTIKSADPSARVLLSSMGSRFTERIISDRNPLGENDALDQLRYLLRQGKGYYDIVDVHAYHRAADIGRRVSLFRDELSAIGSQLPVWITETGGPDPRVERVSDPLAEAANQVVMRYVLALEAGAERIFWHQIAVREGRNTTWSDMALIEGTERRPAFYAYRTMIDKLSGYSSIARLPAPAGVSLFRLTRGRGDVYVLWADAPQDIRLPIDAAAVKITGVNGEAVTTESSTVSAGPTPRYVEAVR